MSQIRNTCMSKKKGLFMLILWMVMGTCLNVQAEEVTKEWKHIFYAISSGGQMHLIPSYDAVSFGWAKLQEQDGEFNIVTKDSQSDFKIPLGFEKPIDVARENGVEAYLMIYFENIDESAQRFLTQPEEVNKVIAQIVENCKGIEKDGVTRGFDGVTIDFENFMSETLKEPYTLFLNQLKEALLKEGKGLYVAVQPTTYFKGYDYQAIGEAADKVILMAHDYEPKRLTPFEKEIADGMTPLTPIDQVHAALKQITDPETGVRQKEKIALQISFSSAQWQLQEGKVLNDKPYRPTYSKIASRLQITTTQVWYHEFYESSYATYEEAGVYNIIWYESRKSIEEKIRLAKGLGIHGISYWRLGLLPEGEDNVF